MPTLLAIETSTPAGSVALLNNDKVIGEVQTNNLETHAATLLPAIDQLLSSTNTNINSIDGIAVSIGPGAFTGLRVGISTAQGLAQTLNIPIYTIPTLEALAHSASISEKPIFATLDARKDEIYGALFKWKNEELIRLIPEAILTPADWITLLLKKISQDSFIIVGNGYLRYKDLFDNTFGNQLGVTVPVDSMNPSSAKVGLIGLNHISSSLKKDATNIKALYLRQF